MSLKINHDRHPKNKLWGNEISCVCYVEKPHHNHQLLMKRVFKGMSTSKLSTTSIYIKLLLSEKKYIHAPH